MKPIAAPSLVDFLGLAVLALTWGSSFFFVEIALESFGPLAIAGSRIAIAAVLLTIVARLKGHRLPDNARDWKLLFLAGAIGTAIPFSLIAWGQSYISSSEAAILMSFTPLATLFFAHWMTDDEKITGGKITGLVVGILGVSVLVGGGAPAGSSSGVMSIAGKLAVLMAAMGYGVSALLLRRASRMPTFVGAAGVLLASASLIVPVALIFDNPLSTAASFRSILAVVWLGVWPSAIAVLVLVAVIARVGATFVALNNYFVPVVGSLLGVFILGEPFGLSRVFGLLLILVGVLITQYVQRRQIHMMAEKSSAADAAQKG
ncbi:membrane protein [Iodidimonas muriae]|uniref:Membrane protein n=1 Tax=Iodidimonas muriae TaxID=261467 RepID=A0ABQ2LGP9_9PROT|nr:membrane protein [Kordiimonadales bacterium JCM 17843]GGO16616.1 membrane protein [Iodidimonas muriae]